MDRVAQHGWSSRLQEAVASWRRALALVLCVSFLIAAVHPAAADLAPARGGGGITASLDVTGEPCGDPADDALSHCCACHHPTATVRFTPLTATPTASPVQFAVVPAAAPTWSTNPPPEPPRS